MLHTYAVAGTYLARLTVTDAGGASGTDVAEITAEEGRYYYRLQAFRQGPTGEEASEYSNEWC